MATLVQKQAWLVEAEAARHKLLTGRQHASVTKEGIAFTYSKQDLPALDAYIVSLEDDIDAETGANLRTPRKRVLVSF